MCAGKNYTAVTIACSSLSLSEERREIESAPALASCFFFFCSCLTTFWTVPTIYLNARNRLLKLGDKFLQIENKLSSTTGKKKIPHLRRRLTCYNPFYQGTISLGGRRFPFPF